QQPSRIADNRRPSEGRGEGRDAVGEKALPAPVVDAGAHRSPYWLARDIPGSPAAEWQRAPALRGARAGEEPAGRRRSSAPLSRARDHLDEPQITRAAGRNVPVLHRRSLP